jgi:hypothetical protein
VTAIRALWALFAADALAIFVTYWRLPPRETYHVSLSGFDGGAGRAVVFLCFPTALAAIAVLGVVFERLQPRLRPVALVALVLCASVGWPGMVDQADLDVKWENVLPATGVLLVAALSLTAGRAAVGARPSRAGDGARIAVAAVAVLLAAPWIAAELGFFLDGVPVLGSLFITGKLVHEPGGAVAHAVHHGHHHGLDGLLLTLAALLLSRRLGSIRRPGLRALLGAYLALLLVYGLTNMVNDAWDEQLFKRGWTDWLVPNVLVPHASLAWAGMLGAAALVYAACFPPRALLRG